MKFRPLQKIEAIMGVGGYLIMGPVLRDYGTRNPLLSLCCNLQLLQQINFCAIVGMHMLAMIKSFFSILQVTESWVEPGNEAKK